MKRFVSVLLLTILWNGVPSILLDRGSLEPQKEEERMLAVNPEIVKTIEEMIGEDRKDHYTIDNTDNSTTFTWKGKNAFIKITSSEDQKETNIEFENQLEKAVLQLNNINLTNKESDDYVSIRDNYVRAFLESSDKIIEDDKDLESTILEILESLNVEGLAFNKALKEFTEVMPETPDTEDAETHNDANKNKQIVLVYEIKHKTKEVQLHSNYFTSSFIVNIRTREYLEAELNKLVRDAYKHAKRMVRFNTSNQESITHNLECSDVKEAFLAVNAEFGLVKNTEETPNGDSTDFNVEGGHTIGYKCGGVDFIEVEVQYQRGSESEEGASPEPKKFIQGFMKSSLYDLRPVLESFFDDIFLHAARAFGIPEPNSSMAENKKKRIKRVRA